MIIYLITLLLLIIINEFFLIEKKFKGYYLGMIMLFIISAFRAKSVGTDTHMYLDMFLTKIYKVEIEVGFKTWINIVREISRDGSVFIFLTSCLQLCILFIFLIKNSKNINLSLVIFLGFGFFFFYLSGMRQSLSLSLFMISIHYYIDKKKILAIILFAVAVLFHSTAIILLPICLILDNIKYSHRVVYLLLILSVAIAWFEIFDISNFLNKVRLYELFSGKNVLDRYKGYAEYDINTSKTILYKIRTIVMPTLLAFFVYKNSPNNNDLFMKFYIWGIIIANTLITFPLGFRIGLYGVIFQIVSIPNIIENKKIKKPFSRYLYLYSILILSLMIKNAYKEVSSYRKDIVPFHFYWDNDSH